MLRFNCMESILFNCIVSWHCTCPDHTFPNGIDWPDLCWETSVSKLTLLQYWHSCPTLGFVRFLDLLEYIDYLSNPRYSTGPLQCWGWKNWNFLGGVQALAWLHQHQRQGALCLRHCPWAEEAEMPDGSEEGTICLHCQMPQVLRYKLRWKIGNIVSCSFIVNTEEGDYYE